MTSLIQRSFSGGEISPEIYSRTDTTKYAFGLKTCRNATIQRHGGWATRPGTSFVGEVKTSSAVVRLIPFIFNDDQTYVLEFGNLYMRVIHDRAYVTDLTLTITAITNANPAVVTYTGTDPSNGQEVAISGIVGAIGNYLNGRNFKIANVNSGANTFELQYMDSTNVNSTSFGSYTSGGTASRIFTLTTLITTAMLDNIKWVQSADVMNIVVGAGYSPFQLTRSAHSSWAITQTPTVSTLILEPSIAPPATVTVTGTAGAGQPFGFYVTAVGHNGEESIGTFGQTTSDVHPYTVTWTHSSPADVSYYNIYGGVLSSGATVFRAPYRASANNSSTGTVITSTSSPTPDETRHAPANYTDLSPNSPTFSIDANGANAIAYIQQRLAFGGSLADPETCWLSYIGSFYNFINYSEITDANTITFRLAGAQVNSIKHLVDLGALCVFTGGGEYVAQGDGNGILTPTTINIKNVSTYGASDLYPLVIGNTALFVQDRGNIVRDFTFDYQVDGYRGNDLTIFSSHLFEGFEIVDWAYQKTPHSIVWAVRDDGALLGLTYVREQNIFAWHRHDMGDDLVENVCVIPNGSEHEVYVCVKRTINGATKRYVERLNTRVIDDIKDFVGMDCTLSFDGRHTGSTTMTLSGGTTWAYDETITLTASASTFTSTDVGNQIQLTGSDGTLIRFTIETYSSATVVTGKPHKTVPASMRSVAITTWAEAVDELTGLWHLEGETVSIFGDGFVVASPNNASYETATVTNGALTLSKPYAVIHVGLPYISDMQTLNIDTPQGETIADKQCIVSQVSAHLVNSRGMWVGAEPPSDDDTDPLEGLYELKIREDETTEEPVALATKVVEVNIEPQWNSTGSVFIRQVDPVPLTIGSVIPAGLFPFRG